MYFLTNYKTTNKLLLCNQLVYSNLATLKNFKLHIMTDPCILYKSQYNKAKETLAILEEQKSQIDRNLQSDPICSNLHKELRRINLDIKITINEMEHAESDILKCELKYNS